MESDYILVGNPDGEAVLACIPCAALVSGGADIEHEGMVVDLTEANELAAWHDAVCPARVERQRAEGRDGGV